MQAYGSGFARAYDLKWAGFARRMAPRILELYQRSCAGEPGAVLDLCCGTGQMARHFLGRGFRVVGIDLSEAMLEHARANTAEFVAAGQATFVHGDARDFALDERFGLVISTFDALNHLEDEAALRSCLACVSRVCDGMFVFDLNTRAGLGRWNSIEVDESLAEAVIITRGGYDGVSTRAWTTISGFVQVEGGLYERFSETVFNTVFDLAGVRSALHDTGWSDVYFAAAEDLSRPLDDPEREGRVFVVARKADGAPD